MTRGPPASSHWITCDTGEPPLYKSSPLLLFSLTRLSSFSIGFCRDEKIIAHLLLHSALIVVSLGTYLVS